MNKFLEKDLEDIIYSKALSEHGKADLKKWGLNSINGRVFRQVYLGNHGIADLVFIKPPMWNMNPATGQMGNYCMVEIYELKKDKISAKDVGQVCRYMDAFSEMHMNGSLSGLFPDFKESFQVYIEGCLIGASFNRDVYYQLVDRSDVSLFTYSLMPNNDLRFTHYEDQWEGLSLDLFETSFSTLN